MTRNIEKLEADEFDVLIVGAGIYGATLAWDASLRGLRVALVDKGDFGGETSSGCFRIIHGGLRYLQHLDLPRLRQSVREQRILRKIAPHLIQPFPFLVPCYGHGKKGREFLTLGLAVYELLSIDKNRGIPASHRLPPFRLLSAKECLELAPGLNQKNLTGGVLYHDCQIYHCERLTYLFAKSAAKRGACIANYVQIDEFNVSKEAEDFCVRSAKAMDLLSGRQLNIRAKVVLNASGPWISAVASRMTSETIALRPGPLAEPIYAKGFQIVLPRLSPTVAVAVESDEYDPASVVGRGARSYFLLPWREYTLLGTADQVFRGDPQGFSLGRGEAEEFVQQVSRAYRDLGLKPENVLHVFGGLRPVPEKFADRMRSQRHDERNVEVLRHHQVTSPLVETDSGRRGIRNFLSVLGVKYTTARLVAEELLNLCAQRKLIVAGPCQTQNQALLGGENSALPGVSALLEGQALSQMQRERLRREFGSEVSEVLALMQPHDLAAFDGSDVLPAEVRYAARYEHAQHLTDVVFRRTSLGRAGLPAAKTLQKVAGVVGEELSWDRTRQEQEIADCQRRY